MDFRRAPTTRLDPRCARCRYPRVQAEVCPECGWRYAVVIGRPWAPLALLLGAIWTAPLLGAVIEGIIFDPREEISGAPWFYFASVALSVVVTGLMLSTGRRRWWVRIGYIVAVAIVSAPYWLVAGVVGVIVGLKVSGILW